jgi:hypothetical protein
MAVRVPNAELPTRLSESMIKQLGAVPEPVEVTWQNAKVAKASMEFGGKVSAADESPQVVRAHGRRGIGRQHDRGPCALKSETRRPPSQVSSGSTPARTAQSEATASSSSALFDTGAATAAVRCSLRGRSPNQMKTTLTSVTATSTPSAR